MNEAQEKNMNQSEMVTPDVGEEGLHTQSQPAEAAGVSEIDNLKQELATTKDQWLRSVADFENFRKRTEREMQEARKYAATEFARQMIDVAENLKRALDAMPPEQLEQQSAIVKTVYSGVEMTMKELLAAFERQGIKRIDPKGQAFDHNLHQAVAQVEDIAVKPGDVSQVIQAGYTIHDRLLRPAMVAVAKAPEGMPQHVDTKA